MNRVARALGLLLTVALATGCRSTPSTYLRSRVGDALDVVPVSVAYGRGVGVSFRATSLLHAGLGVWPTRSLRLGYDDRLVCGLWREYQIAFPWTVFPEDLVHPPLIGVTELPAGPLAGLPPMPDAVRADLFARGIPFVYRWQSARDAVQGEDLHLRGEMPDVLHFGRHPSYARETSGALLVPEVRHRVHFREVRRDDDVEPVLRAGSAEVSTAWAAARGLERMPSDWDRFEFDVFLLMFGARIGIRPLEFVDFVVGLADFDLLGDDLPEPVSYVPGDVPTVLDEPPEEVLEEATDGAGLEPVVPVDEAPTPVESSEDVAAPVDA